MILNSIRLRITVASLAAIAIAIFVANILIADLFKEHAVKQFESTMQVQSNQIASLVTVDPKSGRITLTSQPSEPRWSSPLSGYYWQINLPDGQLLRSRSLWDSTLNVSQKETAGTSNFYYIDDLSNQYLLVLTKNLSIDGGSTKFLLTVASDTKELNKAILAFQSSIQGYLLILAIVLLAILFLQITFGLSPLSALKKALHRFHIGEAERVEGVFPIEFNPLITELNAVIDKNSSIVTRAKTQAGNLAHAMKTPIAVISNALEDKNISDDSFRELVKEQIHKAREQIDWNLAKARAATSSKNPRLKTPVLPVIESIVAVMHKVYAEKGLIIEVQNPITSSFMFNGEEHDLQEVVGNLLDNACKWAKSRVNISVSPCMGGIQIVVEDDGLGINPSDYPKVLRRGFRVDELTQGSGLGLAIVDDLVSLYDGNIELGQSSLGGLRVLIQLPSLNSIKN
jgi:signal transduction histidine kinase